MKYQIKQLLTDMFAEQYKKLCELYQAHENSITDMTKA